MRLKALCVAVATLLISTQVAIATSPEVASKLRDHVCSLNKEQWVEPETVDKEAGEKPAYDTQHTTCAFEFVYQGHWFKVEHRKAVHVSRNFGWSETREDLLIVMVVLIESLDAQNSELLRWTVEDRRTKGRATFGVRDTFGPGTKSKDHFFLPSKDPELDPCVAGACFPVREHLAEQWQDFYNLALRQTDEYLKIKLSH